MYIKHVVTSCKHIPKHVVTEKKPSQRPKESQYQLRIVVSRLLIWSGPALSVASHRSGY